MRAICVSVCLHDWAFLLLFLLGVFLLLWVYFFREEGDARVHMRIVEGVECIVAVGSSL